MICIKKIQKKILNINHLPKVSVFHQSIFDVNLQSSYEKVFFFFIILLVRYIIKGVNMKSI